MVPSETVESSPFGDYFGDKHQSASATMLKYKLIPVIYYPVPNYVSRYRVSILITGLVFAVTGPVIEYTGP